jgi:hypothetical protein
MDALYRFFLAVLVQLLEILYHFRNAGLIAGLRFPKHSENSGSLRGKRVRDIVVLHAHQISRRSV